MHKYTHSFQNLSEVILGTILVGGGYPLLHQPPAWPLAVRNDPVFNG